MTFADLVTYVVDGFTAHLRQELALFLAVVTPVIIVAARHEVRMRRIRAIAEFQRIFSEFGSAGRSGGALTLSKTTAGAAAVETATENPVPETAKAPSGIDQSEKGETKPSEATGDPAAAVVPPQRSDVSATPVSSGTSPSFEFVRSKYVSDLGITPANVNPEAFRQLDIDDKSVEKYLFSLSFWSVASSWRILRASVPYMVACAIGFLVVFAPPTVSSSCRAGAPCTFSSFFFSHVLTTGGGTSNTGAAASGTAQQTTTKPGVVWVDPQATLSIASAAFVGAYLFTLVIFLRSLASFDLQAMTMLRAFAHIMLAVFGTMIAWKAMPDVTSLKQGLFDMLGVTSESTGTSSYAEGGVPGYWYVLAFIFGFAPDTIFRFLSDKFSTAFSLIKGVDTRFSKVTPSTPLDVIDGIDTFTRYRLEEANIFEVQNLATANPIMLHIETPYGIYEVIDWVAQAQLCTIVGVERFLIFRQYNIRTIFDLERAVLSKYSTSPMRRFVGSLLISPTKVRDDILNVTKQGLAALPLPPSEGPTKSLSSPEFDTYVAQVFAKPVDKRNSDETIIHMVSVIMDDLHVHRLREIWEKISRQIGTDAAALDDVMMRRPNQDECDPATCVYCPIDPDGKDRTSCAYRSDEPKT